MRCDIYFENHVEVVNKFYYSIYTTSPQLPLPEREAWSCWSELRSGAPARAGGRGRRDSEKSLRAGPSDLAFQSFTVLTQEKRINGNTTTRVSVHHSP